MNVRNEFPVLPSPYKIAIIGEAPGAEEEEQGHPFVGMSGKLLMSIMSKAGLSRQTCFIGNISQTRPENNNIKLFDWSGPEIQSGLQQLQKELQEFQPNICVLLGATALFAATGDASHKPTKFRGSLFISTVVGPFLGRKCMGAIHPAAILRQLHSDGKPSDQGEQNAWHQLLLLDLLKAKEESQSPDLVLPQRHINIDCDFDTILTTLDYFMQFKPKLSVDIEGYIDSWSCIALAWSPHDCIVIPILGHDGQSYWQQDQEMKLIAAIDKVLSDSSIWKILQNGLYDAFVLAYSYKIQIAGIVDDTMMKAWELLAEMPKDLGTLASIYTREPYWKHESKLGDFKTFLLYNGKDAAVTYEISNTLDAQLTPAQMQHYKFNVSLLNPMLYCELTGMRYDKDTAHALLLKVKQEIFTRQHALDTIFGSALCECDMDSIPELIKSKMCYKKAIAYSLDDLPAQSLKPYQKIIVRAIELAQQTTFTDADYGELETLLEIHLNVDSSQQLCDFLYRTRGYNIMYKKLGNRLTSTETVDELSLLKLYVKNKKDPLIHDILVLKKMITSTEALQATTDADGRIRCGYNITGSNTGRLACYKSPTKSGYNLQTVTRKFRKLFRADPGYEFFDCDLSGADGWTFAALSAMLGDTTMLDDYLFGLKPANIIALMSQEGAIINTYSREVIKALSKKIDPKGWLYFTCKRAHHGTDYGLGEKTLCDQVLKDSYKLFGEPVSILSSVAFDLQCFFHARYKGIRYVQKWIEDEVKTKGYLIAADGSKRIFLGNRKDYDTIKSAFAHLPQHNTTNVLMCAIKKCWEDPENREGNHLIIRPLHQVHDAFNGEWPIERRDWAIAKLRTYFNNPIVIGNRTINIPFEGAFGPSWGEKPNEFH